MKVDCEIEGAPVIIKLQCNALGELQCPSIVDCANDEAVELKKPLNGIPDSSSGNGPSGGQGNGRGSCDQ